MDSPGGAIIPAQFNSEYQSDTGILLRETRSEARAGDRIVRPIGTIGTVVIAAVASLYVGGGPAVDDAGAVPQRAARRSPGPPSLLQRSPPADSPQSGQEHLRVGGPSAFHDFYFTRGIYSDYSRGFYRGSRWRIDYPKADIQFLIGLRRLTNIDAYDRENAIALDDPNLRRYPFLYILEVGYMNLTEAEVGGLRSYLLAGGFLVVDDFWGTYEWRTFETQMRRVLPDRPIVDIPLEHPVFNVFYNIEELVQVPNLSQGRAAPFGGRTFEQDGYEPQAKGILDDDGRLMVLINWNTDLGDAWEWADDPYYPLRFSTFAYEMGINFIIYAMTN